MGFCDSNLIYSSLEVFIQVVFVFSFLVLFYFYYVIGVEKKDFQEQIDLIVDDLTKDIKVQIDTIVESDINKIPRDDFNTLLFGMIDVLEEKINASSKDAVKTINENNNKLKNKVVFALSIVMCVCILVMIIFNCYPIFTILKESIITVFFIAMVELVFLTCISGKYISADPNKIKNIIGTSIQKWIVDNKV